MSTVLDPKADAAALDPEVTRLIAGFKDAVGLEGLEIDITSSDGCPVIVSKAVHVSVARKAPQ